MAIAWLWRPTETSYMLAISQQLSGGDDVVDNDPENPGGYQGGHEFELDDLSLMSHSDDEDNNRQRNVERDSFELPHDQQPPSNQKILLNLQIMMT